MKRNCIVNPLLVLLGMLLMTSCRQEPKKDMDLPLEGAEVEKVEPVTIFENDYVKVVTVSLDPEAELASHEGDMRLIYSLSEYSIQWEENGVDQGTKTWNAGDVHVHKAGKHGARNNGSSRAEWVAFTRKSAEMPTCDQVREDNSILAVAGDVATQLYEDEAFRVTEIKLKPGESIPLHFGTNRLIYSLSDYTIRYESDITGVSESSFAKGDVHWHEGCGHALENTGESEVHFIVIGFR